MTTTTQDDIYVAQDGTRWNLIQECPPIPYRCFDFSATEENHEGEPCGAFGATRDECIEDIERRVAEKGD